MPAAAFAAATLAQRRAADPSQRRAANQPMRGEDRPHVEQLARPSLTTNTWPPRVGGRGSGSGLGPRGTVGSLVRRSLGLASRMRVPSGSLKSAAAAVMLPRALAKSPATTRFARAASKSAGITAAAEAACTASLSALLLPMRSCAETTLPSDFSSTPTSSRVVCAGIHTSCNDRSPNVALRSRQRPA